MQCFDRAVSISKREQLAWENDQLRASLFRGLADAAEGRVRRLDWVTDEDPGAE
ncbi:MAG: hypothetical protein ACRDPW_05725 [Mycobacteriales bacterium]